jgi:hypothetical protein
MSDLTVANTILEQLGGREFVLLTGSRSFTGGDDFLMFALAANKSGANKIKIILTPLDTYTVQFWKINARARKAEDVARVVSEHEHIYCDMLQDLFFDVTGLYTTLVPREGSRQHA